MTHSPKSTTPSRLAYAVFLVAVIFFLGGIAVLKGGLYVDRYEGDVAHMLDIILRMAGGQVPHLDFSTPLGIMAFLPIVALNKLGLGIGLSFIVSQIVVALILAPMAWRVATTRLSGACAWLFGLTVMVFVLALVHGGDVMSQSVSMYYNRWAWAASFIALFLAIVPERKDRSARRLDGAYIGLLLACLALIKPTFFVAFVLPVVAGLATRGAWRSLSAGLTAGAILAAIFAMAFGVDFYIAYVQDLLSVARSETRAAPGVSIADILNSPPFLVATLSLILSVIVLRQGGHGRAGFMLLLLAPGFIYVTYQNFGNDPKWLMFLCLYLMVHRPERGARVIFNADARNAVAALALVSFALFAPSFQNLLTSPSRHFSQSADTYQLQIAGNDRTRDVWRHAKRGTTLLEQTEIIDRLTDLAAYGEVREEPVQFLGEDLPRCTVLSGDAALHAYMADRLKQDPFGYGPETQFFVTDMTSAIWMSGGFAPLVGGAPWYYSGAPGIENADAIVIPLCPMSSEAQGAALSAIENAGLVLKKPIRDDVMLVYPIER